MITENGLSGLILVAAVLIGKVGMNISRANVYAAVITIAATIGMLSLAKLMDELLDDNLGFDLLAVILGVFAIFKIYVIFKEKDADG